MPEVVIPDKYVIPKFTLPEAFTNPPETKPETPAAPPPEAKPAAEAPATEPVLEKTEPETTGKDPESKPSQRSFDRKIDRLTRRVAEAEARAIEREKELAELKTKATPPPAGEPKMEDFTDIKEYAKAFAEYEKKNAITEYESKQKQDAEKKEIDTLVANWDAKVADSKYDDFYDVVGDLKPTSPWSRAVMEEDNGDEVAYYLGKHLKEVQRIAGLSPLSQAREIGKLSFKLANAPDKPKQPSKAPAPIEPVSGTAVVATDEIKPNQDFESYRKVGNKMFRVR